MSLSKSNDWRSPYPLVAQLARNWGPFELDVAAAAWNRQAPEYFTKATNGLKQRWWGRAWCNPPYSRGNLERWLAKARLEVLHGHCRSVVCLVPAYTADGWWQRHVARPEGRPLRADWLWGRLDAPLQACTRLVSERLTVTVIEVSGRLKFTHQTGVRQRSARYGSAVVVFERECNLKAGC